MTYDPAIPAPADLMSVSQGDLLENFSELNTQFGVNHVEFNDSGADKGKHKFCSFVEQSDDPSAKSDECIIYSKEDDSGDTELFIQPEAGAGDPFQITKDASLFLGLIPLAAVNFEFDGTAKGNVLNVTLTAGKIDQPNPAKASYIITFTNPSPDANYFWSVSGFDSSNNPVIAQVTNDATYSNVVTPSTIQIDFKNQNNTVLGSMTGACAVCWRIQ